MASALQVVCDGAGAERVGRPGGWAFLLVADDAVLSRGTGREAKTSSLVMELTAALRGLEAAREWKTSHRIELVTDCRIALDVASGAFLPKPPRYHALCRALREAFVDCGATARWVKGHSGERWNEEVDALAAAARDLTPSAAAAK